MFREGNWELVVGRQHHHCYYPAASIGLGFLGLGFRVFGCVVLCGAGLHNTAVGSFAPQRQHQRAW